VVAAREVVALVHALLDNGPLAGFVDHEGVYVELKAIRDGIVIDPGGEAACPGQFDAVKAGMGREIDKFIGSPAGVPSASSAEGEAKFGEPRIKSPLQCAKDRGCDAGGVPVHAHYSPKSLKPEGIAETGEELGWAVGLDHTLGDSGAEQDHALDQPGGNTSAVEGEIGGSGALHSPIFSQTAEERRTGLANLGEGKVLDRFSRRFEFR
jgi:hypothetical protein